MFWSKIEAFNYNAGRRCKRIKSFYENIMQKLSRELKQ